MLLRPVRIVKECFVKFRVQAIADSKKRQHSVVCHGQMSQQVKRAISVGRHPLLQLRIIERIEAACGTFDDLLPGSQRSCSEKTFDRFHCFPLQIIRADERQIQNLRFPVEWFTSQYPRLAGNGARKMSPFGRILLQEACCQNCLCLCGEFRIASAPPRAGVHVRTLPCRFAGR